MEVINSRSFSQVGLVNNLFWGLYPTYLQRGVLIQLPSTMMPEGTHQSHGVFGLDVSAGFNDFLNCLPRNFKKRDPI